MIPGSNDVLSRLARELVEYFEGKRKDFAVAYDLKGTAFQKSVWRELRRIPYGQTASYTEIAGRVGRPGAVRALAQANGANPLYLLVPCHRVIASDGALSGYGGGVWRKRRLLELERRNLS